MGEGTAGGVAWVKLTNFIMEKAANVKLIFHTYPDRILHFPSILKLIRSNHLKKQKRREML